MKEHAKHPTIIPFPSIALKCPVNSVARHCEFGWCEVIGAEGLMRTVRYEVGIPLPIDEDDMPDDVLIEEVMLSETIECLEAIVHVGALTEVNPLLDMGWLRGCEKIVASTPRSSRGAEVYE
jgi:hypothetical protein